jgi:dipeptidyl-peptidase-4
MGTPIGLFPSQQARTRRFSLGAPRSFTVSPDGERVVFLRSPAGDDPVMSLWVHETGTGSEREVVNAARALGPGEEELPVEERARRERSRELAGGIVGYACDSAVAHAAFSLGSRLWWVALGGPGTGGPGTGRPVELDAPPGVVDPRPDPTGRFVAFLSGPRLCAVPTSGDGGYFVLAEEPGSHGEVTWGAAEFIAAEEMGRSRGYWWAPDGGSLLAARVDNSPVTTWWTADASAPATPPQAHRFPPAGSDDAVVSLWYVQVAGAPQRKSQAGPVETGPPQVRGGARDGQSQGTQVCWDAERYPYLAAVHWDRSGPPLLLVVQRDHKACAVLAADAERGATSVVAEAVDKAWVSWPPGLPAWSGDGRLLWAVADSGTWRLKVGDEVVTPPGLQVREVMSTAGTVVFTASTEPEVVEVWEWSPGGRLEQLTDLGGVSSAAGDGHVKVVVSRSMGWHGARAEVRVDGSEPRPLESRAETPVVDPAVRFLRVGDRQLSVGLVLPTGHQGGKLPVVMAPYGGPGGQLVMAARSLWLAAQWLADQGFAVIVADGRGTPGRGPDFEREVYRDLAGPPLEDQVHALHGAAEMVPELDLGRVGIKGWSFGGYLAALAVLARPDVFHAAIAGAPVTDWRLYDTYYTERFLGHPDREPEAYERTSLLALAPRLSRPLMIVHGLSDDNVFAVHTLRLSRALLAAGRPHSVLPLPGMTHMASGRDVTESLLLNEVDFFRRSLG